MIADNGAADFLWGFVVARDETPYPTVNGAPQPHPVAPVGSLVYYRKQHAAPVLVDGNEIQALLHENNILCVELETQVELKNIAALPLASKDLVDNVLRDARANVNGNKGRPKIEV